MPVSNLSGGGLHRKKPGSTVVEGGGGGSDMSIYTDRIDGGCWW